MMLLAASQEYICVPLNGPYGDLTVYPVKMALMPDNGAEPGGGDWQAAQWLSGEVALLRTLVMFVPGTYMAYVQITAGPEIVAVRAGRVRIGDTRT